MASRDRNPVEVMRAPGDSRAGRSSHQVAPGDSRGGKESLDAPIDSRAGR